MRIVSAIAVRATDTASGRVANDAAAVRVRVRVRCCVFICQSVPSTSHAKLSRSDCRSGERVPSRIGSKSVQRAVDGYVSKCVWHEPILAAAGASGAAGFSDSPLARTERPIPRLNQDQCNGQQQHNRPD